MATGNISIRLLEEVNKEKTEKLPRKKIKLATDKKPSYEKDIKKPEYVPEPIKVNYTPNEGVDDLSIAIVAANEVQAKDFVCSLYCNLTALTQTSELSFYTRQHHTIAMLTETKQYLERVLMNPSGRKITCTNSEVYSEYILSLGQTANQKLSLNLHFYCCSYDNAVRASGADIVLVLVNTADTQITAEQIAGTGKAFGNRPVTWVFTGFARENIYYTPELDIAPSSSVTRKIKSSFSQCMKNGDSICYAQQYGGIVIEEHEGNLPVYTTIAECREYTPVACSLPLAYSLTTFRKTCDESRTAVHKICDMLNSILRKGGEISNGWHEKHLTAEGI